LSRGGGDAVVVREFDTETKTFVADGFSLPEAKSQTGFKDIDTLWVGTDFGPGSLTTSGYPRITKLWKRGTPLSSAKTVFEADPAAVASGGYTVRTPEGSYDFIYVSPTFFTQRTYLMGGDRLVRLPIPEDASFMEMFRDRVIFQVRSDWKPVGTTYRQGSLLSAKLDDLLQGNHAYDVIYEPAERSSLGSVARTHDHLLVTTLDNVRTKLLRYSLNDGAYTREELALPGQGDGDIRATNDDTNTFFYGYQDFLTPGSLYVVESGKSEKVKSLPAYFDAAGMSVAQYEAPSADGTKIPYFVVMPKGFKADGKAPTLLYAYGGFEQAETPFYSGVMGNSWLARGGVFVLANIRGGGEFGPGWHLAAIKENRIKTHEDFIAIAEDLIKRKITSSEHLGIEGGSNGGLLVGTAFTLRPDLFKAVVCQVPLLDMKRYSHLLAGASWMDEYGDPDKAEDWAYMKTWSPYQNVSKDKKYPRVFFWTTTRDDRVHPGHARKMVAKMTDQGHPVLYFENIEGGHGSGSVNAQRAMTSALEYSYLWKMLKSDRAPHAPAELPDRVGSKLAP
jgi:prolyl oligopeptidase